jgi:hypothetical protein
MIVSIWDLEFEADVRYWPGRPAYIYGPPEFCYPEDPAEAEFANYGPYESMEEAVYVACWYCNEPMTVEAIKHFAYQIEERLINEYCSDIRSM